MYEKKIVFFYFYIYFIFKRGFNGHNPRIFYFYNNNKFK